MRKGLTYAQSLATAPLYLHAVTQRGERTRTIGRPRIQNDGTLILGNDVILRSVNVPVELCTEDGASLTIGDGCSINYGVSIGATSNIVIGSRVRIGPYAMIIDCEFHDVHQRERRPPSKPVVIEDDVWIGAKASVMPGVRIGRGSIVGTGVVVTQDVEPYTVVAGVPAKVVRKIEPLPLHEARDVSA